jgi:hypothetical protein
MLLNFKKCDEIEVVRFRNMKFNLTAKESSNNNNNNNIKTNIKSYFEIEKLTNIDNYILISNLPMLGGS